MTTYYMSEKHTTSPLNQTHLKACQNEVEVKKRSSKRENTTI